MDNSLHTGDASLDPSDVPSRKGLEVFFVESLQELYFTENAIATEFDTIRDQIQSPHLKSILENHYQIHLKFKERLEKIFAMRSIEVKTKKCDAILALIAEGQKHFDIFSNDIANWEIALILISQKMAHYKIASYGACAHLAINLNDYRAATLLAVDVQEEEDYINNHLNGITHEFLRPYSEKL